MPRPAAQRPIGVLVAGAIAAGIIARLGFLGTDSLWVDEAFSIQLAGHTSVAALWAGADPRHPPLFYILLKGALHVLGTSAPAARVLSAVASLVNLWLLYVAARGWSMERDAALLAVSLLALSPLDIWYAREARMYELAITALLLTAIGLSRDGWQRALGAAIGVTFALYVDFSTLPMLAILFGLWWARWWWTARDGWAPAEWCAALALAAIAIAPMWPQLERLATAADSVTVVVGIRRLTGLPALTSVFALSGLIAVVVLSGLAGIAVWPLVRRVRGAAPATMGAGVLFLAGTAVLIWPRAFSLKQVLVTCWPLVCVGAAWLIAPASARIRVGVIAVAAVLSALSLTTHRAEWRGAVAYLDAHAGPGAVVVIDPVWNQLPYDFYAPRHPAHVGTPQELAAVMDSAADVWLIAERYGQPPPTSPAEIWLDGHADLVETREVTRLELRRYRVR